MDLIDEMLIDNAIEDPSYGNLMASLLIIRAKEIAAENLRKRLADGLKDKFPGNTVEEIVDYLKKEESKATDKTAEK